MGWAAPAGRNVPSWLLDSEKLAELFERLEGALKRPPSFSGPLNPALLAYDAARLGDAVSQVSNAARSAEVEVRQAFAELHAAAVDTEHARRMTELVNELTGLWSVRVIMALGLRRSNALRRLLKTPAPDLLGIFRREEDENAHSDVLRFLLDPRRCPALAPVALSALVSRLSDPEAWRAAVRDGIARDCVSVRREVVCGQDLPDDDSKDRIDLVVTGPGFALAVENKVNAAEHEGQTRAYARWLRRLRPRGGLRAGLFLSPSGIPAASPDFRPLSYLELVACLLEAPAQAELPAHEQHVLAAYLKTLSRRILRAEFNAILETE